MVSLYRGGEKPYYFSDTSKNSRLSRMGFPSDILTLIKLIQNSDGFINVKLPRSVEQSILEDPVNIYASQAYLQIPTSEFGIIFVMIRKIILDWTLKCEKQGILGEEWMFTDKEKEMAQHITNYNIGSVHNMANNNQDTTIHQSSQNISISKGDFTSLANFLTGQGMNEPDIQELKEIIDNEPDLTTEGMNNHKIQGWIGKIATKIASGTKAVATGVTVEVIVKALEQFF